MQRYRDTGEKANFLRRHFLKKEFLDPSASFAQRHPFTAGRQTQKLVVRCLFKIGMKLGVTCLIISEVSRLICHEHCPLPALAGNSDSVGLSDT